MANLISVERASLALGTAHVLDEVSLGVLGGDRIGVVGRNGGGKTTLIRVLAGHREVDTGTGDPSGGVERRGARAGGCPRPGRTRCARRCSADLAEHVWAGDPRIRDVLTGLLGGIGAESVGGSTRPIGPLSGGERRRLGAGPALLVQDPTVLFLDEPTNHLDVEGVAWLAEHLVRHRARPDNAVVAITHDRWFLDAIATDHLGGRRRQGQRVRGRLRGLRAGQGRARADGRGHRRAARQPAPQGARLAAAWAAGAHHQTEVPHRRGQLPHRRRTARARRRRADAVRDDPARQGRGRPHGRLGDPRRPAAARPPHLAPRAGRAGRHRRRQRRRQVDPAARHRGPRAAVVGQAQGGRDRPPRLPHPGGA